MSAADAPEGKVWREWWLDIATPYGDPCDFIHTENPYEEAKRTGCHPCISATNIHVIEIGALHAAQDEIASLTGQLAVAKQGLEHAIKACEKLKERHEWLRNKLQEIADYPKPYDMLVALTMKSFAREVLAKDGGDRETKLDPISKSI